MEQEEQVDAAGRLGNGKEEQCEGGTRMRAGWHAVSSVSYTEGQTAA